MAHHPDTDAPYCMPQLPQELSDKVIDEVGSDLPTLRNCSLVCRGWLPRSAKSLFSHAEVHVRSVWNDAELIRTLLAPGRVSYNVTTLSLHKANFDEWRVVKELPRLHTLTVYCCYMCGLPDAEMLVAIPGPLSSGRRIEVVDVQCVPLGALDWLLHMFTGIDTLRVHCITPWTATPPSTRHVVRSLRSQYNGHAVFRYLTETLDATALEELEIDVSGPFERDDGHEALVEAFVQNVGREIKRYRHIDRLPMNYTPHPPNLSRCAKLTSAVLSTAALNPFYFPNDHERALAFLDALPPGVEHVRLTYMPYWENAAELAAKVRQCSWGALGAVLLKYGRLSRLDISVEHMQPWRAFPQYLDDPALSEEIRQKLPERFRDMVNFV
ncbi:hypothetical protein PsYK624_115150 [Phanerochaete sordida]|uniref:F-box domain-containing protein n=1 Tax=Phanerochaete sordida TaxID=48140 RepID=A0A9P3GI25_9APHY|nr:hypothetical protein PsYK624_115150 [Phanerochaete sordida]